MNMQQVSDADYEDLLNGQPFFNLGLPNPVGSNSCFINSILISMRSIECIMRSLVNKSISDYYVQHPSNNMNVMHSFMLLIRSMLQDNTHILNVTKQRRKNFIDLLVELAASSVAAIQKPIEENRQGDPQELFMYLVKWLNESIEIMRTNAELCACNDRLTSHFYWNCHRAAVQALELQNVLNESKPLISDMARCPRGHKFGQTNNSQIFLNQNKKFLNIQECLADFFGQEKTQGNCALCTKWVTLTKERKLEQVPEKMLVLSLIYQTDQYSVCFFFYI